MALSQIEFRPITMRLSGLTSATESLFIKTVYNADEDFITANENPISDDTYVLAQYVLYLYVKIFVQSTTNCTLVCQLQEVFRHIKECQRNGQLKDKYLNDFIAHIEEYGEIDAKALSIVAKRLSVTSLIDPSILYLVLGIYSADQNAVLTDATLYKVLLSCSESFSLELVPIGQFNLDTTMKSYGVQKVTSLYWKLIYSLEFKSGIDVLNIIAQTALPLNPTSVYNKFSNDSIEENGIPFCNKIAIYKNHQAIYRTDGYRRTKDISKMLNNLAVSSILGEYSPVIDANYAEIFINGNPCLTDNHEIKTSLYRILNNEKYANQSLYWNIANEAASITTTDAPEEDDDSDPEDPPEDPETDPSDPAKTPDPSPEIPSDPDPDEPVTGDQPDDSETPLDSSDDNIESSMSSTDGSDVVNAPIVTLIPLASQSETLDDHLFRLAVLDRKNALVKTPDPKMSPDDLEQLRSWCSRWLFLASVDATKELLAQLKITGITKEFK